MRPTARTLDRILCLREEVSAMGVATTMTVSVLATLLVSTYLIGAAVRLSNERYGRPERA